MLHAVPTSATPPTTRRLRVSVRDWTRSTNIDRLPSVPGASPSELSQLAALGGLAAAFAGAELATWPDEIRRWAARAPRPPDKLIELFKDALEGGIDPFAEAYIACVAAANRRRLGTIFTPDVVVQHMLDLVDGGLPTKPTYVVDPGAGVGAFTLAAARRWPKADVIAVDINIVTLGLLGARLSYERSVDGRLAKRTGSIELRLADYLEELPVLFSRSRSDSVVTIGNPPFTRTQELPPEYKRRAARLGLGMITSGHANLATIFQALTLQFMRSQDMSCMILPGSVMFTRAARDIRRHMFVSSRPVTIHRWPATARAFIGRNVQAAVVAVGPTPPAGKAGPIQLARAEVNGSGVQLLDQWQIDRGKTHPTSWYSPSPRTLTDSSAMELTSVASFRRGLATGANAFFFLTDSTRQDLPANAVIPAIPSLRRFAGEAMTEVAHRSWGGTNERRWLLALSSDEKPPPEVQDYLDWHEAEVRFRYLCAQRATWWAITDLPRPQILLSPLAKESFKVVRNLVSAVPSNNLIGIDTRHGDPDLLAAWLRSGTGQDELRRVSRRYHGGSHKIEPGDLKRVRLPADIAASMVAPQLPTDAFASESRLEIESPWEGEPLVALPGSTTSSPR